MNNINELPASYALTSTTVADKIIPVIPMEAPWDFAEKHYPGGWKAYVKEVVGIIFKD